MLTRRFWASSCSRRRANCANSGRAPIRSELDDVLPPLQERGFDGLGLAGQGRALPHPQTGLAEPCLEIGDGERDLGLPLLEQRGREERVVHFVAKGVEGRTDARLGLAQARPLRVRLGLRGGIEDGLLDGEVRIHRVLEHEQRYG